MDRRIFIFIFVLNSLSGLSYCAVDDSFSQYTLEHGYYITQIESGKKCRQVAAQIKSPNISANCSFSAFSSSYQNENFIFKCLNSASSNDYILRTYNTKEDYLFERAMDGFELFTREVIVKPSNSNVLINTFDGKRRITNRSWCIVSGSDQGLFTISFNHWDDAGRPTTGTATLSDGGTDSCSNLQITYTYTGTVKRNLNRIGSSPGNCTVLATKYAIDEEYNQILAFDRNGNIIREEVNQQPSNGGFTEVFVPNGPYTEVCVDHLPPGYDNSIIPPCDVPSI